MRPSGDFSSPLALQRRRFATAQAQDHGGMHHNHHDHAAHAHDVGPAGATYDLRKP
ncbi:hypothetical protein KBY82_13565 [Cyanobium sp. AMD-g]|uniref:hypothetical protein n=1 Tax=Cyanobium sp. AMD-g TaxID=2823699 RepID=UPI0020CDF51B|nr:hypothetical protein [Cyanobium sp. AMD-g]MCP9931808.1 hypothetical protein [Cyanobium sp. AMD-g]